MKGVSVFTTHDALNQALVDLIDQLLKKCPALNISLSGGSTPKAFFDYWAAERRDADYWRGIRLFWGDERCVPPDDPMSNYGMTKTHLLDKVPIPAENIFRIKGENDPEQEAIRYGALLGREASLFDLVLLGLGDDGHTVSIFPASIGLWDSPDTCVVNTHPESGMKRVTITGKVVNAAHHVAFLVTGKNKAEKVHEIVQYPEANMYRYPAAKVNPASGNLLWLLDKEAAALL